MALESIRTVHADAVCQWDLQVLVTKRIMNYLEDVRPPVIRQIRFDQSGKTLRILKTSITIGTFFGQLLRNALDVVEIA